MYTHCSWNNEKKKHHSLLEEKCHKLDEKIANCLARQEEKPDIDKSTHFGKHVRRLRRKNRKSTNTDTKEENGSLKYRSGFTAIELDKALK